MSIITRFWHWLFPPPPPPQWKDTAQEEFGAGNFHYVNRIFAEAGDIITCENGHIICIFMRNVSVGDFFDSTALGMWTQPEPKLGTFDAPCATCGARWFKGAYFHFPDGWRIGT